MLLLMVLARGQQQHGDRGWGSAPDAAVGQLVMGVVTALVAVTVSPVVMNGWERGFGDALEHMLSAALAWC